MWHSVFVGFEACWGKRSSKQQDKGKILSFRCVFQHWLKWYVCEFRIFFSQIESLKSPDTESNTSKGSSMAGSPLKLKEYFVAGDMPTNCRTGAAYKPCTIHEARWDIIIDYIKILRLRVIFLPKLWRWPSSLIPQSLIYFRKLLTVYQLESQGSNVTHPLLPLWVLCDQTDAQNTVALSSHVTKSPPDTYLFRSHVVTTSGKWENPHFEFGRSILGVAHLLISTNFSWNFQVQKAKLKLWPRWIMCLKTCHRKVSVEITRGYGTLLSFIFSVCVRQSDVSANAFL